MYQPHFLFAIARYQIPPLVNRVGLPGCHKVAIGFVLTMAISVFCEVMAKEPIVRAMSELESGSLLFLSDNKNHFLRAPLLDTSVEIGVQGMIARTVVEQRFSNHTTEWVEGIYAFPLPDNAIVDELSMIIGETVVKGKIQTRKKATATYTTAKSTGKKASLLEQQRANLFTTRLANIPPGESITIRFSFQSAVRYVDSQFSLYFPLTITPRYLPAAKLSYNSQQLTETSNTGWTTLSEVQDADKITPPMTDTAAPVSISVTLDTGLSDLTITSSSHDIVTTEAMLSANKIQHVSLANALIPADRDFKLSWAPQTSAAPVAAAFRQDKTHTDGRETFTSLMLMPPQKMFSEAIPSREVIFVIDISNSMSGNSIRQARKMLAIAIERLSDDDLFNVLAFNDHTRTLFPHPVQAGSEEKNHAISWVHSLSAHGGTEILGALQSALASTPQSSKTEKRLQQIVFITDGSVGNESDIFHYLNSNIGNSRLFTVGIGSAPNTWFMRKSAELGRGTYTSIANTSELLDKSLALLAKIEQPAITDIKIQFDTHTPPEVYPVIMPDVYMGEPVLADARWPEKITQGNIKITGRFAGQTWEQTIKLGSPGDNTTAPDSQPDFDKLWAARKIQALEDSLLFNTDIEQIEDTITDIALAYSMVTKYTSLVAVEDKVSRDPITENLHTAAVPQAIPAGNTMHYPQGSLGITLRFLIAFLLALLALLITLAKRKPDTRIVCTPMKATSKC